MQTDRHQSALRDIGWHIFQIHNIEYLFGVIVI